MEAYKLLYGEQLTQKPKKMLQKTHNGYDKERGWVFVSNDFRNIKAVRTYSTLKNISDKFTYFTPNTFYRNDQRHEGSLRWLNAIVIDVDVKNGHNEGLTLPDLLDRVEEAGLPRPSLVVSTPSGGFHVYFYYEESKRALPKVINLHNSISEEIAKSIDGDHQAIGAERWFRIPTVENICFETNSSVSFSDMYDWLLINRESNQNKTKFQSVQKNGILNHPAVQKLLKGDSVFVGQRDNTCYTLALCFKLSGYSKDETENRLIEWNDQLEEPLRLLEVKRKVRSAYKKDAPAGPSTKWIRLLSGMNFSYRPMEGAKSRDERTYSHFEEWKSDIISYLKKNGSISGSQKSIADEMNIPLSTFKEVIKLLEAENRVEKVVEGKGRYAKTTIKLTNILPLKPRKTTTTFNKPNSNTYRDMVVGGKSLPSVVSQYTSYDSS